MKHHQWKYKTNSSVIELEIDNPILIQDTYITNIKSSTPQLAFDNVANLFVKLHDAQNTNNRGRPTFPLSPLTPTDGFGGLETYRIFIAPGAPTPILEVPDYGVIPSYYQDDSCNLDTFDPFRLMSNIFGTLDPTEPMFPTSSEELLKTLMCVLRRMGYGNFDFQNLNLGQIIQLLLQHIFDDHILCRFLKALIDELFERMAHYINNPSTDNEDALRRLEETMRQTFPNLPPIREIINNPAEIESLKNSLFCFIMGVLDSIMYIASIYADMEILDNWETPSLLEKREALKRLCLLLNAMGLRESFPEITNFCDRNIDEMQEPDFFDLRTALRKRKVTDIFTNNASLSLFILYLQCRHIIRSINDSGYDPGPTVRKHLKKILPLLPSEFGTIPPSILDVLVPTNIRKLRCYINNCGSVSTGNSGFVWDLANTLEAAGLCDSNLIRELLECERELQQQGQQGILECQTALIQNLLLRITSGECSTPDAQINDSTRNALSQIIGCPPSSITCESIDKFLTNGTPIC